MHPEDGEIIPPRPQVSRDGSSREEGSREEGRGPREEALRPGANVQGFGDSMFRQAPPGFSTGNYPVLGQPQNLSVFRPWMNQQVNN